MEENDSCKIRFAKAQEWEEAMTMVWRVFLEFEGPDYTREGIRSFEDFITDSALKRMFLKGNYQMMVAYDEEALTPSKIAGIITLRDNRHISLLFVDKAYHKKGVGKTLVLALCSYMKNELGQEQVTVNASPYGVGFYHKIGFEDMGPETWKEGICYTPMRLLLDKALQRGTNGLYSQ